ncbi:SocA family protein [Mesorhizobium caraganae]|uniref:Panacea domain-containing protein n=1 Tax=Mesorhizobium caraganae TaxID=483206 RepID=UPI00193AAB6E|nr:Panacea domain-containing protein [Mesorhizobium caraganae]MBM2715487.1 SocA family protein [Mesorhizobium caraganae]
MGASLGRPMNRQKAEVVQLKPNVDRVIAAVAYAIHVAENMGAKFTQYDVVKSIFLADRAHLNEFGRLISSDKYVAMEHGPVPSTAYNLLKDDEATVNRYRLDGLPWRSTAGDNGKRYYHSVADVAWIDGVLSPSDKAAIEAAVGTIRSLSFSQVRKLTHEDPAYVDAWEESEDRKQFPMSLGMLFDAPNFERARQLSEMSTLD